MKPPNTHEIEGVRFPQAFDDGEVRLHHLLGQHAPPTEGGRHILWYCWLCKRPWYQAGKAEHVRLTATQFARCCAALGVTRQHTSALPEALCPLCSTVYLGGLFRVGEYQREPGQRLCGYQFTWISASSPPTQLIAMMCRREHMPLSRLLARLPDLSISPAHLVQQGVCWLASRCAAIPEQVFTYEEEDQLRLARRLSPGGPAATWQGYSWIDDCPCLHGEVIVSLAQACASGRHPPGDLFLLLKRWQQLATTMALIL